MFSCEKCGSRDDVAIGGPNDTQLLCRTHRESAPQTRPYYPVGTVLCDMHDYGNPTWKSFHDKMASLGLKLVSHVQLSLHHSRDNFNFVQDALHKALAFHRLPLKLYENKQLVVIDESTYRADLVAAYCFDGSYVALVELEYL